jgi:hypothetical protein
MIQLILKQKEVALYDLIDLEAGRFLATVIFLNNSIEAGRRNIPSFLSNLSDTNNHEINHAKKPSKSSWHASQFEQNHSLVSRSKHLNYSTNGLLRLARSSSQISTLSTGTLMKIGILALLGHLVIGVI